MAGRMNEWSTVRKENEEERQDKKNEWKIDGKTERNERKKRRKWIKGGWRESTNYGEKKNGGGGQASSVWFEFPGVSCVAFYDHYYRQTLPLSCSPESRGPDPMSCFSASISGRLSCLQTKRRIAMNMYGSVYTAGRVYLAVPPAFSSTGWHVVLFFHGITSMNPVQRSVL